MHDGTGGGTGLATFEQLEALEAMEARAQPAGALYGLAGYVPPRAHSGGTLVPGTGRALFFDQREKARLDFAVETAPLYQLGHDGQPLMTEHVAVRNARTLAVYNVATARGYRPIQFSSIDDTLGALVDAGVGVADGVLRLRGGAVGIGRVKLAREIRIPGDDSPVNAYFQIIVPHDGTLAWGALASCVRAVCENTMRAALADAGRRGSIIKIRHTATAEKRVEAVGQALKVAVGNFHAFERTANMMARTRVSDGQMMDVVNRLLPEGKAGLTGTLRRSRERVMDLWSGRAAGMTGAMRGTAWGAYNAVTEYADHWTKIREETPEKRVDSALFGRADALKASAVTVIQDVVGELV